MKCIYCNAELEPGANYCTVCGKAIPEEMKPVPEETAPEAAAISAGEVWTKVKGGVAAFCAGIKPFFSKVWGKTRELAKKCDEKLDGVLGEKKMYAYAGVIGLVGLIIVISAIAGLIPNGNGYLPYKATASFDTVDDTVYMLKEGKVTELKTDAEGASSYQSSIDGKVSVIRDDGVLYLVKGKKTVEIAEDVGDYTLSLYGDSVVYQVVDGLDITYYYSKLPSGKSVELHENEIDSMLLSYTISPDGKSVAYIASDDLDADLYYFNGKKSEKVDGCDGSVIGMSNGGKYIYTVETNDEGKTSLHSYNKKGKDTKIDSCSLSGFALNLDGTQIMFYDDGKTYVSVKAKEPVRVAGATIKLLTPSNSASEYKASSLAAFYPVESLYDHVYTSGSTAYYVSKKESKNVKLVKADSTNFTLDNSGEYLYYIEDEELMVLKVSKGDKAEDKAKTIAKDVGYYLVTSNRKYVYFVNEDYELHVVNGKKGGKSKELSDDEVMLPPVISEDDVVYYLSDEAIYATKGKKKGKEIMDDALYFEDGGYVYIADEDSIYAARGRSKPKKLIDID